MAASMIAAVCWVPRGAANPIPLKAEPPADDEIEALKIAHDLEVHRSSDAEDDLFEDDDEDMGADKLPDPVAQAIAAAQALRGSEGRAKGVDSLVDDLAELDMEHYDDEDEGEDAGIQLFGNGGLGAAYYASNAEDPYIVNKEEDDEEDEIEDMTIKESDLVLLTARTEDDVSHLEVWVYESGEVDEDGASNMYVHHDIMLPAFPLSLAWLDCGPIGKEKGNFVAIGTMQPEIEIWDLDIIDEVEPVAVLGGPVISRMEEEIKKKKSKKKKKEKKIKLKEGSHTDAVLGLAWNLEFRNVVASGSADNSVKIWDVVTQKCQHTVHCHNDKVQAVAWNKKQPTVLLSGSFDRTVAMVDGRAPDQNAIWWGVGSDVESLAWDPHTEHTFVVSLEDGTVCAHDIRNVGSVSKPAPGTTSKTLYTIHAHEKAVCSVSFNSAAPNLLATTSTDKTVKLWDLSDNQPTCIGSVNPKVGAIFSSGFCNDLPFLLAVGGSKGNLHVWNTLEVTEVANRFGSFASGINHKK
ncbi:periodic tryptophan protein 1 [Marchantia polymorpha subsp. ruderalis]|uniref:Anaphase-promoting complex subunit 4-like WD40 domain-containing protein n=2 Tax=Marchantia polymorpha TaxID=3197 RepID=A0AAF6B0N6_MARPO|nr:hypothetical protein MARPO_0004s0245 [Marchantia polymorpha]BBN05570.1 hypothetical protein Mp_3g14260 [Marchantia polymorpha subsp. ruderalis]|eukprot:PTQ49012.1 hypothetical protein MARPO_0004s0245 [Marchantia polymorpha]